MTRALAVAGVMGAGTALVFLIALIACTYLPSDRLTWQAYESEDVRVWIDGGQIDLPRPIDPAIGPLPDRPWLMPAIPDPGTPRIHGPGSEPADPGPIDPTIEG